MQEELFGMMWSDFSGSIVKWKKQSTYDNMWYAILMKEIGRNKKICIYLLICAKRNSKNNLETDKINYQ